MNIYLASRYSRRLELCGYRDILVSLGHTVTARWLDGKHQLTKDGQPLGEGMESAIESESKEVLTLKGQFAMEDLKDVAQSHMLVLFTDRPRSSPTRGGCMVEYGFALASAKMIAVIGPRQNVFCCLPDMPHFHDWDSFLAEFKQRTAVVSVTDATDQSSN